MKKKKVPITFLVAQDAPEVIGTPCDFTAENDTKHPASDDSDTI